MKCTKFEKHHDKATLIFKWDIVRFRKTEIRVFNSDVWQAFYAFYSKSRMFACMGDLRNTVQKEFTMSKSHQINLISFFDKMH